MPEPCPSCGHDDVLAWCPACGERQFADGWRVRDLVQGLLDRWLVPVRPVVSLPWLLFQPGLVAEDVLAGRVRRWPNPLAGYLGLVALSAALSTGLAPPAATADILEKFGGPEAPDIAAVLDQLRYVLVFLFRYAFIVIQLPLFAGLTRLILGPHRSGGVAAWTFATQALTVLVVVTTAIVLPMLVVEAAIEGVLDDGPRDIVLALLGLGYFALVPPPMIAWIVLAGRRVYAAGWLRPLAFSVVLLGVASALFLVEFFVEVGAILGLIFGAVLLLS